jgi:Zn-finger nucleic acid-binding protein
MICPNDNTQMHQVRIQSHYGQPIILEQCGQCGGIWFDESELFRAKQGEAGKIELLDTEILRAPVNIEKPVLKCPRDKAELFQFKDRYFPKGIILERCPSCNGIWLNRGHFTRFQEARQEFKRPEEKGLEDKRLEEEIERVLAMHQAGDATGTLEKLGSFLSTPIDRNTLLPLGADQEQTELENTANLTMNLLMLVFRALVLR